MSLLSKHTPAYRPDLKYTARRLRAQATPAERLLWSRLRRRRLGVRFLRQRPIGAYVVDFYCPAHWLVVELDGMSHKGQRAYDVQRERCLKARGIRTLRFSNEEVLFNLTEVVRRIGDALATGAS